MSAADLNVDANDVIARLSAQIANQAQTITIQQLQIEKLQGVLAQREALIVELTPTSANGKVKV